MIVVTGVVVWKRGPKHVWHIILCNATVLLGRSKLDVLKGFCERMLLIVWDDLQMLKYQTSGNYKLIDFDSDILRRPDGRCCRHLLFLQIDFTLRQKGPQNADVARVFLCPKWLKAVPCLASQKQMDGQMSKGKGSVAETPWCSLHFRSLRIRLVHSQWIEIPSRELTYPPKMAFWRWFSFSQGGIC